MLRRSNHRLFHMQVTVVCSKGQHREETQCHLCLHSVIIKLPAILIKHSRSSRIGRCKNDIVCLNVEEVKPIIYSTAHQFLREGQLVVPEPLRLKVGILWRIHIHLSDYRIAESLGGGEFKLALLWKSECESKLRNNLCSYAKMPVHPETGIKGNKACKVLTKICISGSLPLILINLQNVASLLRTGDKSIYCLAAIPVNIHTKGCPVALQQRKGLVSGGAHHIVVGDKTVGLRSGPRRIAVIYPVMSPIIEEAYSSRCLFIFILQIERCHTPCNILISIYQRRLLRPGLGCAEVHKVYIRTYLPIGREAVRHSGHTSHLLKT